MAATRKYLLASAVFTFVLVSFSRIALAKVYEWNDFTKPFNKQFIVALVITVEVDLPDFIVTNFKKIPLVIEHSGLGLHTLGSRFSGILTINDQQQSRGYRLGYHRYTDEPVRLLIDTEELKAGLNKFHFRKTSDIHWANFDIYKLYFDLQDIEKIRTASSTSFSASDSGKKTISTPTPKVRKDIEPPEIIVTSHDTARGVKLVEKNKKITIQGQVVDQSGIVEVLVDGKEVFFDRNGTFSAEAYLGYGENQIVISAMDRHGNRAKKTLTIFREASFQPAAPNKEKAIAGNYYALVIGNNNYKYLKKLTTAKKDAARVATVLRRRYGFDVKILLDATRHDIVHALNLSRKKLLNDDSFLIYYAGHGEFDKATNKAYWLPVDARSDEDTHWIIVDTITSNIKRIACRHILIIADSCYSGTLTRRAVTELDSAQKREHYLSRMKAKRSRTLLASGGNEPVSDIGGQGHSIFARALLRGLNAADHREFTAEEFYYKYIKEMVAGSSEQIPEYNIIRNSGHEGGDFVFKVKN